MLFNCRPVFVCYVYMDVLFFMAIGRDRMRFFQGECVGLAGCFSSSLLSPPQGPLQKFSSGKHPHSTLVALHLLLPAIDFTLRSEECQAGLGHQTLHQERNKLATGYSMVLCCQATALEVHSLLGT